MSRRRSNGGGRARLRLPALAALLFSCALPAVAHADACPNERLRAEDNSTALGECRAYELVSPPQKNGSVVAMSQPVLGAPSGDRALYNSTGVFAGAQGSPLANGYVASRDAAAGWSTRPIEAPQANDGLILVNPTQGISADLTKTLQASALPLAPGAVRGNGNVYIGDVGSGEHTLVGTSNGHFAFREFISTIYSTFVGATEDFSHVVFNYSMPLTPGAVEGSANLYDWTGGQLHLVNYLPDGSVAPDASGPISGGATSETPHQVSADGSKVLFSASGVLYARLDNTSTIALSASQRTGDKGTRYGATFGGASVDGTKVFFTAGVDLTDGPAGSSSASGRLYRYDFRTGQLTGLTVSTDPGDAENGASVNRVLHVSDDGSYVYFTAQGDLAPGAKTAPYGTTNVYVWHEGDGIKLIAQANVGGQVSPNGRHFAFLSADPLTSYECGGCTMLYEYDYLSGDIRCVSCLPGGGAPAGPVEFGGLPYGTGIDESFPRVTLDNGMVLFASRDALVPQDSNGQYDVYMWQDGHVALISAGTSAKESAFAEASPDGRNIFFKTGQKLVGQDVDEGVDLYAARIDGGFPAPPVGVACSGTSCQGIPSAPPIFATPPSTTFNGVGNFEASQRPAGRSKPAGSSARAHKLAAALKACHKRRTAKKRLACERGARKRYGKAAAVNRAVALAKTDTTKGNGRGN